MHQDMLIRIEEAALNAWPAPKQMLYDGWLLRFAGGYTKRANSVNVIQASKIPLKMKILYCERVYTRIGLPILYRLPQPFTSPTLMQALQDQNYHFFDPTLVLGKPLADSTPLPEGYTITDLDANKWIQLRASLTGTPVVDWEIHQRILEIIVPKKTLVCLSVDGKMVACGMGVVEGDLLGYFSIYTGEAYRRKGYARAVMAAVTHWGLSQGATFGYLQVEGDNNPALNLYDQMGFRLCYQYHYCRKEK